MDKFPDTLFKMAGWLEITDSGGVAIAVFESLENEGAYFVQSVFQDTIADFSKIDRYFKMSNQFSNMIVRRGDDAVFMFITQKEVLVGNRQYVSEGVRQAVDAGSVPEDVLIEAMRIIGNDELVLSALDERYFRLKDKSPQSAEFFRQNNILRDLVIAKLPSGKVQGLAANCLISASGNVVEIKFSVDDDVSLDERDQLRRAFSEQVRLSRSFSTFGFETQFEFPSFVGGRFKEFESAITFDLPYPKPFLAREGGREIFVPIGMLAETLDSSRGENGTSRLSTKLMNEVMNKFKEFQIDSRGLDQIIRENRPRALNLVRARNLSMAMMMVAKEWGIAEWERFGKIRCCVFAVRHWGVSLLNSPEDSELLCINALYDRFLSSEANKNIAFDSFFQIANRGQVSQDNFLNLSFGFSNPYLELLILVMHGLNEKRSVL